jgi:hypothetical protein
LAFLTSPVGAEMAPGIPTPTVPECPRSDSIAATRSDTAADRRVVVAARRCDAAAQHLAAAFDGDGLDFRPADVDADPHRALQRLADERIQIQRIGHVHARLPTRRAATQPRVDRA